MLTRSAGLCIVIVLAMSCLASAGPAATSAPAGDWPQFRGPTRDGKSAETGLLAEWPAGGPKLLWSVDGIGKGFSHVSVAGGLVYSTGLVGKEGILRAYGLDGKLKWEAKYGPEYSQTHPGARTIPTVNDGRVYVMSALGRLSCFDAAKGEPLWSVEVFKLAGAKEIQWGYAESVLIDGDNVIVTPVGKKAAMMAFGRKTGKVVWASPPLDHESSFCSPVLVEHGRTRMLVTLTDRAVVAFAAADGKVIWQHPYQNERQNHPVSPIYHDGMLYVTSGYGKGAVGLRLADDGRSVKQIWEQPSQDPVHGQAVLVDGYVYASSHESIGGKWSCVELETGKLMWQDAGVGKGGSVIFADGMLYCYSESGFVGIVRPSSKQCQVVSTFKVPLGDGSHWAHPVVSHGRLFIRHGGTLMCYAISADLAKPQ
jgi:outer membrane protein assembly factor BamB